MEIIDETITTQGLITFKEQQMDKLKTYAISYNTNNGKTKALSFTLSGDYLVMQNLEVILETKIAIEAVHKYNSI